MGAHSNSPIQNVCRERELFPPGSSSRHKGAGKGFSRSRPGPRTRRAGSAHRPRPRRGVSGRLHALPGPSPGGGGGGAGERAGAGAGEGVRGRGKGGRGPRPLPPPTASRRTSERRGGRGARPVPSPPAASPGRRARRWQQPSRAEPAARRSAPGASGPSHGEAVRCAVPAAADRGLRGGQDLPPVPLHRQRVPLLAHLHHR